MRLFKFMTGDLLQTVWFLTVYTKMTMKLAGSRVGGAFGEKELTRSIRTESVGARVAAVGVRVVVVRPRRKAMTTTKKPALHDDATEFGRAHPELREVDDDVFEHPRSRVFDQAENRMHTAKAVMVVTL